MRVMKFGGSSLGTPGRLRTVVRLVSEAVREEPVVVVASAVVGVTDRLEAVAGGTRTDLLQALPWLGKRHRDLWAATTRDSGWGGGEHPNLEELRFGSEVGRVLRELEFLGGLYPAGHRWDGPARDRILGAGEGLSAPLLASLLRAAGVPARSVEGRGVIRTDSAFGEASVRASESERLLRRMRAECPRAAVPVLGGFTGADPQGRPTTLGRGTSDVIAALLGGALSARVVEIWTDVDGIHRHDPRAVPDSPLLPWLDYAEARALAREGAKVLHPRTLDPLEPRGIPLLVRNTLKPEGAGTLVGPRIRAAEGRVRELRLVLAGATGGVGSALLERMHGMGPVLRSQGWTLKLVGALNSRSHFWEPTGIPPREVSSWLARGAPPDLPGVVRALAGEELPTPAGDGTRAPGGDGARRTIFVDCTASPEVSALYLPLLESGTPVVTANKLAGSGALSGYLRLMEASRAARVPFRYETTVGAALPVLGTIRELRRTGHAFLRISGVLSGTLSYLFARLARGQPFSSAVREARELGLTEPHPGEDLSGKDVARKMVILLREAGIEVEADSLPVESLVPPELAVEEDPNAFLAGLEAHDESWAARVVEARGRGQALAYVASFEGDGGEVGVRAVPTADPLATLRPTENVVLIQTDLYTEVPLAIAGPGAGRALTASGVLADILAAGGVGVGRIAGDGGYTQDAVP